MRKFKQISSSKSTFLVRRLTLLHTSSLIPFLVPFKEVRSKVHPFANNVISEVEN